MFAGLLDHESTVHSENTGDAVLTEVSPEERLRSIEPKVERALEYVRPFLHVDGGGVELVRIDLESMVVEVCLTGACRTCSLASMTLRAGIERAILHAVPEIKRVESVTKPGC